MTIKFGTDGWRAIIAEDFTFANVQKCAQGVASYIKGQRLAECSVVIGYDTRVASEDFAAAVAEVIAGNNIPVYLFDKPSPTPVLSFSVVNRAATAGIMITASHNPAQWNGFKYRPSYGGSAPTNVIDSLEQHITHDATQGKLLKGDLQEARSSGLVNFFDPKQAYLNHLENLLEINDLRTSGLNIVIDYMHGAGSGYLNQILQGDSTQVYALREQRNPAFPDMSQPEPIARNLKGLSTEVVKLHANVGLAFDGDADRLGVVDENGVYLNTLQVFALLAWYLLEFRGQRGALVKSITTTDMIYKIGQVYKVPVFETPVGFKFLGPAMIEHNALIAGEESGGYAFRNHIPERDGILSGLYLIDLMVQTGKTPSDLLRELESLVGPHCYDRKDIVVKSDALETIKHRVDSTTPKSIAGIPIISRDTLDGTRFRLEDGAWALIRFSGTEPLLRIYAEAQSDAQVRTLIAAVQDIAGV